MFLKNMSLIASSLMAALSVSSLQAAPITFNTALPVSQDEILIRQQSVKMQSADDPSGANRDRTEVTSVTAMVYGINSKLSIFGILPYRGIELKSDKLGQRVKRSNRGIGDISVFGRYIFKQINQTGSSTRYAAFAGIKLPTGDHNAEDSAGTLPRPVQTGTGSWDVFGGMVATRQTLGYQLDGQLSYRINNEANGVDVGDIFRADGSFQKRLWPAELGGGVPDFLYGVIEANFIYQDKDTITGTRNSNSGGTRLLISPGIQYVARRWIAEGGLQIPVWQNLNGNTLELDYITRAGIRINL